MGQDGITLAVPWRVSRLLLPDRVTAAACARIDAFNAGAERLAMFTAHPTV